MKLNGVGNYTSQVKGASLKQKANQQQPPPPLSLFPVKLQKSAFITLRFFRNKYYFVCKYKKFRFNIA